MKLKISCASLRALLLELYVSEDGKKVSDREIMQDERFMRVTGFYKKLENGALVPCSVGNPSYWKRKLDLMEIDVYEYHTKVTGKIPSDVTFKEFSKLNNYGHKKKTLPIKNFDRKYNLVRFFGLNDDAMGWDLDVVEKVIFDNIEELGGSKLEALLEFEDYLSRGGGETEQDS